jgi:hypothetical protein
LKRPWRCFSAEATSPNAKATIDNAIMDDIVASLEIHVISSLYSKIGREQLPKRREGERSLRIDMLT